MTDSPTPTCEWMEVTGGTRPCGAEAVTVWLDYPICAHHDAALNPAPRPFSVKLADDGKSIVFDGALPTEMSDLVRAHRAAGESVEDCFRRLLLSGTREIVRALTPQEGQHR